MRTDRSPTVAVTKFVAVNVTPEARDILRLMAVNVSAAAGRRVSMSDALAVIDAVAKRHPEEITEEARRAEEDTPS
ncbi:hypothetical protein [Streptomyces sp. NPDC058861]|uniref:hypothetical protein n=1 Tax=Streptomyces sp. NPDC058861 TaxID=3346653 RepID=UPI0036B3B861